MTGAPIEIVDERQRRSLDKLRRELGPVVLDHLARPDTIEIMLNDDGRIWVERLGHDPEPVGELSAIHAAAAIGTIAAYHDRVATAESPIVEVPLPLDGSRFEGVLPPVVARPVFTIRLHAKSLFTLEQYVASGIMAETQAEHIKQAIRLKHNIVVTGGTGSGKTTLLNAIAEYTVREFPELRTVVIQDIAELRRMGENCVMMLTSVNVSLTRLLAVVLRLRPDSIKVGEVRDGAALAMLKLWNTGHVLGLTSIHSNQSFRGALIRLEQMVLEAIERPVPGLIAEAVNTIVGIEKFQSGRRVTGVYRMEGYRDGDYVIRNLETGELV